MWTGSVIWGLRALLGSALSPRPVPCFGRLLVPLRGRRPGNGLAWARTTAPGVHSGLRQACREPPPFRLQLRVRFVLLRRASLSVTLPRQPRVGPAVRDGWSRAAVVVGPPRPQLAGTEGVRAGCDTGGDTARWVACGTGPPLLSAPLPGGCLTPGAAAFESDVEGRACLRTAGTACRSKAWARSSAPSAAPGPREPLGAGGHQIPREGKRHWLSCTGSFAGGVREITIYPP